MYLIGMPTTVAYFIIICYLIICIYSIFLVINSNLSLAKKVLYILGLIFIPFSPLLFVIMKKRLLFS